MTDAQKLEIERDRVASLLEQAVAALTAEGGDIRCFNAAFLVAAIQLQAEMEGPETIVTALTKVGVQNFKGNGSVASC
jgi:hypothetical protein